MNATCHRTVNCMSGWCRESRLVRLDHAPAIDSLYRAFGVAGVVEERRMEKMHRERWEKCMRKRLMDGENGQKTSGCLTKIGTIINFYLYTN